MPSIAPWPVQAHGTDTVDKPGPTAVCPIGVAILEDEAHVLWISDSAVRSDPGLALAFSAQTVQEVSFSGQLFFELHLN